MDSGVRRRVFRESSYRVGSSAVVATASAAASEDANADVVEDVVVAGLDRDLNGVARDVDEAATAATVRLRASRGVLLARTAIVVVVGVVATRVVTLVVAAVVAIVVTRESERANGEQRSSGGRYDNSSLLQHSFISC